MRAKDFISEANGTRDITINIPITVTIPADGSDPQIAAPKKSNDSNKPPTNAVMVSPLQQELELAKHEAGKESAVIDQINADDGALSVDDALAEEPANYRQVQRKLSANPTRVPASQQNYTRR